MIPVVAYIRVSRVGDRGGDSFISPDLQAEAIAALAKREGLKVVETLRELDASGGDNTRPLWNQALAMVEQGKVQGIAVWNLSRFSRSVKDALNAIDRVEAAGGRLYSATEETGNRMLRTILLAVAENERERAKDGFQAAVNKALDRGIYVAAKIPLGYMRNEHRQLVINPETAPIVVGLFERRANGWSWARLAKWVEEQGYPMSDKGVSWLVRNRVYLGELRWGNEVRKDESRAIVSKALFEKANKRGNKFARTGELAGKHLLQKIATCAGCGNYLYLGSGGQRKNHYYWCRNLKCQARAYAPAYALDDFVVNEVERQISEYSDMVDIRVGNDEELESAKIELREAEEALDGFLANHKLITLLGQDRYNSQVEELVRSVDAARARLEEAQAAAENRVELIGKLWLHEWGQAERHEWLSKMVEACVVTKGRDPLSKRVAVTIRR
jgi:site-specific DNA recombinase